MSHLNDIIKPSFSGEYPKIQSGSKGDVVKTWQAVIGVPVDGNFGSTTVEATKKWQKAHGLKDDGIVGPSTWATMPNTHEVITKEVSAFGNKLWLKFKQLPLWMKIATGTTLGGLFFVTRKRHKK